MCLLLIQILDVNCSKSSDTSMHACMERWCFFVVFATENI